MTTENEVLIEEMMLRAEAVAEPGELTKDRVVYRGDEETPPMVATVKSAGWVVVYDNITGEASLCNRNMLLGQLKKRREDGSLVFTTVKPDVTPFRGNLKCMLHQDLPSREDYDQLGLPTCPKSNLTSPFQVLRHMQKRHKMEWAAIENERVEAERKEERELRRLLLTNSANIIQPEKVEEAPLYVSPKKAKGGKSAKR